uniref:Uncharacterized protein n=1 Tax=Arundo donax TaxID=35708 RepID=A0A0A9HSX7_ARUDO
MHFRIIFYHGLFFRCLQKERKAISNVWHVLFTTWANFLFGNVAPHKSKHAECEINIRTTLFYLFN